jgi:predicted aspartyl protease
MENVKFVEIETMGKTEVYAIIDHGNDQFTSMPKAIYDELNADETKTK